MIKHNRIKMLLNIQYCTARCLKFHLWNSYSNNTIVSVKVTDRSQTQRVNFYFILYWASVDQTIYIAGDYYTAYYHW